jgi:hypothetical protein
MSWDPTSPLTGASQTGLTSPTYTLSSDVAPDSNGEQHAVTALGGTQTGVDAHSVSKPFTLTAMRPKVYKGLGPANQVTGFVAQVPRNRFTIITRKGVEVTSSGQIETAIVRTIIEVPAGADVNDAASVRAMLSCHIGALSDQSSGVGDSQIDGVL